MKCYAIEEYGKPLVELERPVPEPTGTEVLVRVRRCGICHSDLHIREGQYDLGSAGKMTLADRGITLPRVPGHEVLGEAVKGGDDAGELPAGLQLVFPWLGCGSCRHCTSGRDNMCAKPSSIGVFRDGGYAEYVLVPHRRYLLDIGNLEPSFAATLACSGVTVYSAMKKVLPIREEEWFVVIGAGGLGLIAVSILEALGNRRVISLDIDDAKLDAARSLGAEEIVNSRREDARARLLEITGGDLGAVLDVVGASETAKLGVDLLPKGASYVLVGLYGGELVLPLPTTAMRSIRVQGSYVGNPAELRELLDLAQRADLKVTPVTTVPLSEAPEAFERLQRGEVVGRLVLAA